MSDSPDMKAGIKVFLVGCVMSVLIPFITIIVGLIYIESVHGDTMALLSPQGLLVLLVSMLLFGSRLVSTLVLSFLLPRVEKGEST